MHNFPINSLRIGLSRTNITVLKTTGWFRPQTVVAADVQLPEEALVMPECLNDLLSSVLKEANCSNMIASIILTDDLVRFFMVTPPQNTGRIQDCEAAAAMRFQILYDETVANWDLSADWDMRYPFLACAIPHSLLATIHQVSEKFRLRLIEITPQFISAANHWRKNLKPEAWFGVVHENVLTIGAMHQSRLCAVRSTYVPENAWSNDKWLPEYLGREALRLNLPPPSQILLSGKFSGNWTTKKTGALICTRLGQHIPLRNNNAISAGIALAHTGTCL